MKKLAVDSVILLCGILIISGGVSAKTKKREKKKTEAVASVEKAKAVIKNYCDIGHAAYSDSLITAKKLEKSIELLIRHPTVKNLTLAKKAWVDSRVPYQQTEVYRFGNKEVDDWEGKVNSWPLDEGLIDYVDTQSYGISDENPFHQANIIGSSEIKINGKKVKTKNITSKLLRKLHEVDGIDTNVATGYHAIEFLLWGQDLNGTGPGAGHRPASDYGKGKACTHKNCDRRGAYLKSSVNLLVNDLKYMKNLWAKNGKIRRKLLTQPEKVSLKTMITGMGSLSYGELAGERIKLGLMLHDPEEEHDCFSDNTHNSHYYDALGIRNIYLGEYVRVDGTKIEGPSLADMVQSRNSALAQEMTSRLNVTMTKMTTLVASASKGQHFDQLIAQGNTAGSKIIMDIVKALMAQTKSIEKVGTALKLDSVNFEGSDSL